MGLGSVNIISMQGPSRAGLFAAVLVSVFVPLVIGTTCFIYKYSLNSGQVLLYLTGAALPGIVITCLVWLIIRSAALKPLSGIIETEAEERAVARVEQEKLAAMGEVSAGLAHEIRNPLSAIISGISLLESDRRTPSERERIFKLIKTEAQRLNSSLTQFLLFARPHEPLRVRIDLGGLIREIVQMIEDDPEVRGETRIVLEMEKLDSVWFDDDQLRQVIWNVALNAIQAMKGKGELTIKTEDAGGGFFRIEIEDTGPGVPEELRDRIFAPFFSTKKEGAGLGLSIVRRILIAHGGSITLETKTGTGAKFIIIGPGQKI